MGKKNSQTFELLILGSSSATPSQNRHPSAQLLNIQEQLFLIDCGEATQLRLFNHKIKWNNLSHIFITHLHGDHVFGLPGLLNTMGLYGRSQKLILVGPTGIKEFVETILRLSHSHCQFEIDIHELEHTQSSTVLQEEGLEIVAFPLDHRVPCLGYVFRFENESKNFIPEKLSKFELNFSDLRKLKRGEKVLLKNGTFLSPEEVIENTKTKKSFAYCSDTKYNESILPFIHEVDLLYHETTYRHDLLEKAIEMGHSTSIQAATMAKKANVGTLVTGHYSSRYSNLQEIVEECQTVFPNTTLGKEDLRIKI